MAGALVYQIVYSYKRSKLNTQVTLIIVINNLDFCLVQCRIAGRDYAAVGNSTSKKDAQTNAARDMVQYLVRVGEMKQSEVPDIGVSCFWLYVQDLYYFMLVSRGVLKLGSDLG